MKKNIKSIDSRDVLEYCGSPADWVDLDILSDWTFHGEEREIDRLKEWIFDPTLTEQTGHKKISRGKGTFRPPTR